MVFARHGEAQCHKRIGTAVVGGLVDDFVIDARDEAQ